MSGSSIHQYQQRRVLREPSNDLTLVFGSLGLAVTSGADSKTSRAD